MHLSVYSFGTNGGLSFGSRDGCKPKPLTSVFRSSVEALQLAFVPRLYLEGFARVVGGSTET